MQISKYLRQTSLATALAVAGMAGNIAAHATSQPVVLPTGATITPDAARGSVFQPLKVALPDYPNYSPDGAETTAVSPDGKSLLILTSGFNLNLDVNGNYQPLDSGEYVFVYDISNPGAPLEKQVVMLQNERAFDGVVWSPDGTKFYVAGGADDVIHTFAHTNSQWAEVGTPVNLGHSGDLMNLETLTGPTAAMVGITADGKTLFVANHETDSVTSVDLTAGAVLQELDLRPGMINVAQTGVPGGEFPYGVAVKGNSTVYVSSVRDREIDVLNFSNGTLSLTKRVAVSGNPEKMILNHDQSKLFVVAANSDSLIVVDTKANKVVGQVNTTAPFGVAGFGNRIPKGSNPNSVALSPDEKTAYVTNGGTNSVAVISLWGEQPFVVGLIPTGWYPNSVSVSPDGGTLYVVNSKSVETANPLNCRYAPDGTLGGGFGSGCNNALAQVGGANQYAWQNEYAGFLTVPVPKFFDLFKLTAQVAKNNGFNFHLNFKDAEKMEFLRRHIQHVIYIVKENRTFDQILGDLTNGANADPALTQFPQAITPNFHNFANNFVTLDNFDDSSMVSMDGWQWSLAARALDINEKCVTVNYGKGGCQYDSEGTARNINVAVLGVTAREQEQPLYPPDPNLLPGPANEVAADGPDGGQGKGYLWDAALSAGLSVRNYGFYLDLGADVTRPTTITPTLTDPFSAGIQVAWAAVPALLNRTDIYFRGFDQTFPDYFRYTEWLREFKLQEQTNTFPNLTLLRLDHDHFGSFGSASFGVNTPELQIADDDYSVGLVVDTIAHSSYANNTLVFVIEDDPQDGADHVSGDRSLAFIVGPYVKHNAVVSTFYNTVAMMRTMEDVLGLPHLSIHDSGVAPMADAFDTNQDCDHVKGGGSTCWSYSATPSVFLKNTTLPITFPASIASADAPRLTHDAAWWAAKTKNMDFSAEDLNNPGALNRIIWEGLMGGKPYPNTRSGANLSHAGTPQPETRQVSGKVGTN